VKIARDFGALGHGMLCPNSPASGRIQSVTTPGTLALCRAGLLTARHQWLLLGQHTAEGRVRLQSGSGRLMPPSLTSDIVDLVGESLKS